MYLRISKIDPIRIGKFILTNLYICVCHIYINIYMYIYTIIYMNIYLYINVYINI